MILVTGATGFLGSELVTQLRKQGKKLRALKREGSSVPLLLQDNLLVEWVVADINDLSSLEDAFEGVTQVYHCAALVSFNPADKEKLLKINIEGSSNVANLCAEYGIRLLHVSSIAALGLPKKGLPVRETDFWEYDSNVDAYAISKYEGEMEVWRGIAEGLDALIVNPSVIIGPNAPEKGTGSFFKMVLKGLRFYTKGATGFVDVRDVARSMILLMDSKESGERFTISAENYYYKQFLTEIANAFGLKAPAVEAKPWMLAIGWRLAKVLSLITGKAPLLTRSTARSSQNIHKFDNEKIKKTTGITFKPLHESIKEVCAGFNSTLK